MKYSKGFWRVFATNWTSSYIHGDSNHYEAEQSIRRLLASRLADIGLDLRKLESLIDDGCASDYDLVDYDQLQAEDTMIRQICDLLNGDYRDGSIDSDVPYELGGDLS